MAAASVDFTVFCKVECMTDAVATLEQSPRDSQNRNSLVVTLASGGTMDIAPLDLVQLMQLQWREERAFAAEIAASAKGSKRRGELFARGYDTVTTIHGRILNRTGTGDAVMGFDPRYAVLVR